MGAAISDRSRIAVDGDARWKKIKELITRAIVDTSKVTISAILGQRGALIGRTPTPDACFLFLRLSFSGTCGLPRLSLYMLKRCKRRPCFTSHSPRSCKHGFQCRYS